MHGTPYQLSERLLTLRNPQDLRSGWEWGRIAEQFGSYLLCREQPPNPPAAKAGGAGDLVGAGKAKDGTAGGKMPDLRRNFGILENGGPCFCILPINGERPAPLHCGL